MHHESVVQHGYGAAFGPGTSSGSAGSAVGSDSRQQPAGSAGSSMNGNGISDASGRHSYGASDLTKYDTYYFSDNGQAPQNGHADVLAAQQASIAQQMQHGDLQTRLGTSLAVNHGETAPPSPPQHGNGMQFNVQVPGSAAEAPPQCWSTANLPFGLPVGGGNSRLLHQDLNGMRTSFDAPRYGDFNGASPNEGPLHWHAQSSGSSGEASRANSAYANTPFAMHDLAMAMQQGSAANGTGQLLNTLDAGLGGLPADNGRAYTNGGQQSAASSLWGYGSPGRASDGGLWGNNSPGVANSPSLSLQSHGLQQAGHWAGGPVSAAQANRTAYNAAGEPYSGRELAFRADDSHEYGGSSGPGGGADQYSAGSLWHQASAPPTLSRQQPVPSHHNNPQFYAAPARQASDSEVLARQLRDTTLSGELPGTRSISADEQQRQQQQLIYLQLLQQQDNINRQHAQLQHQQAAIASAAAALKCQGGGGAGGPASAGALRREGSAPTLQHMRRGEQYFQHPQKQLYQQQPLSVGLRGQPPHPQPPSSLRPPQRAGSASQTPAAALSIHDKRWQPVTPVKRLPKADVTVLSQQLTQLVDALMPTSEECARQAAAFDQVSRVLKGRWPEGQVHLFGSTANCLAITNSNDIDVCLELPDLEGEQAKKAEVVDEMARLLEAAGMRDVLPLGKARVPVVKCIVPATGTKVDVTLNHTMAIINTKLLADYCAIDGRLTQLVFIVKHWAKRRQVNDAYRGTLSSYCYVLMCIHLLQQRQPPVLPCLQAMQPHSHKKRVGQWDCDYYDKVGSLVSFGKANTEALGELVWAFFEYWAWKHDYNTAVISVRTGGFLTKAQKEWTRRIGNERHLVSIEDPFELSHDLGRTVDRQTSMVLHKEFERAACILRDLPNGIEKLFEPYRAGKAD